MTLNLAYSCNAYMHCSAVDAVSRIAALAYRGVELMADVPHLWPADATAAEIDAVREAIDAHDLSISNLNAFMMNKIGDARQPYWHPSWIEPDADYAAVRVTGETGVEDTAGQWAILAGIAAGSLSLDQGPDLDVLTLELGAKRYMNQLTSLALIGNYGWNDGPVDFEVGTVTLSVKQRFQSASRPISPFLRLDTSMQFVDQLESYDVLVIAATLGCDFMMGNNWALVFEGGVSESEEFDDGVDRADGWIMGVAMQYYWE